MPGFIKSLFRRRIAERPTADGECTEVSFDRMSVIEIAQYVSSLPDTAPAEVGINLTKRAYELAYYEHGITPEDRTGALELLKSVKHAMESAFASTPDMLEDYRSLNQSMEQNICRFGVGSLFWLMKEHGIPDDEVISYVMRPENDALVSDFFTTLPASFLNKIRPALVRNLIALRSYAGTGNAVLTLHGLAARGDKAVGAVFTPDECTVLLAVPENYDAGRQILVALGLLPAVSGARSFTPRPLDDKLASIAAHAIKGLDGEPVFPNDPRLSHASPEEREVLSIAALLLQIDLTVRVLTDIYGVEVAEFVRSKIFQTSPVREALDLVERVFWGIEEMKPGTPIDLMVLALTIKMVGAKDELSSKIDFMKCGAEILNNRRVEYINYIRFTLRSFVHPSPIGAQPQPDAFLEDFVDARVQ